MAPKRNEGSRVKASKGTPQRRSTKRAAEPPVTPPPPPPSPPPAPPLPPVAQPRLGYRGALVGLLVLLAIAAAIVGVLRLRDNNGGSFSLQLGVPTEASPSELQAYASGSVVYWIGPPKTGRFEVTRTAKGLYVRYLPAGVALGDPTANYTTIATYPMTNAYATLKRSEQTAGSGHLNVGTKGLAVWRRSRPTSVYVAYQGVDHLIEVYDRSPRRALSLAVSRVRRVR